MDSPTVASFVPISGTANPTKDDIAAYYRENGLTPENDYLTRYLAGSFIPTTLSSTPAPTSTSTTPLATVNNDVWTRIKSPAITETVAPATSIIPSEPDNTPHQIRGRVITNFLMSKGLTKAQAAGIKGNLLAESNFDPQALGDNGTSYGIAQWHKERWTSLKDFATKRNMSEASLQTQLEFLWEELQTTHKGALTALLQAKTPTESARIFSAEFERPKVYDKKREIKAEEFYLA